MTYRLIYSSIAEPNITNSDFRLIAMLAAVKNAEHDINGLLLNYNEDILQVLEGKEAAVKQLYASIKKDNRHHSVTIRSEGFVRKAEFKKWSMGYRPLNACIDQKLFFTLTQNSLNEALPNQPSPDITSAIKKFLSKTDISYA